MRKFFVMLFVVMFLLTGCFANQRAAYYNPFCVYSDADYEIHEYEYGEVLSGDDLVKYEIVFEKVCKFAGFEKELPQIIKVTQKELCIILGVDNKTDVYAKAAFSRPNKLYILEGASDQVLAHEMLHYMSTDGIVITRGLIYEKEGYEMGRALNEGVTDYFSILLYPGRVDGPYEYEKHAAKNLADLVGLEELKEAYFNSDVSNLRRVVNNSLKNVYEVEVDINGVTLDQFDILTTTLYGYYLCLMEDQTANAWLALNSVEEMFVFMSKKLGAEEKIMGNQEEFLEEYPHLEKVTFFSQMW